MFRYCFLSIFLLIAAGLKAQITTVPELPVASQSVTITFNSAEESRLGYFTGDLYAHTGVILEGSSDWQHVIGAWGDNTVQPKLTNKGNGIYELNITPDINTFYSVTAGEKVVQLAFVFRSTDNSKQTRDLFVNVYEEGLAVQISEPSANSIFQKNQSISIAASTSIESTLQLYADGTLLSDTMAATNLTANHGFTQSGYHWIIAKATANNETKFDSVQVFIRDEVNQESKPAAYRKGINYPSDTTAALVLWAPKKEFVFVLGDFNNWQLSNAFQMKKDNDYFWLEIPGLEKGKEYIFQYLIDGKIKIADPYTEKIVDPWNDQYISSATYPNLIPYPENKTEGIASVLQPGQQAYNWEVTDFQIPDKRNLSIYELLVRDFTTEHSFNAVREKLDYLDDLNINVLELMPVNEFEGNSSWGYNPSFYFAPDKYYGSKNELKKLIDECHKRGIAVVLDMVLNHSYGQSPFVQMYMDNWTITPDNPWYNVTSPNPTYSWGYDFNQESTATQELVDSVNSFWMSKYKVDGFRFDFTKGFTNTPGDGWAYDASRIAILERMAGEIWKRKSDALVIFEHFTNNPEEKQLSDDGIMLWGNMNGNYREAARGNVSGSDLSWGVYDNRGWTQPNLVTYAESHDEERVMVECLNNGFVNGDYNIKQLPTALDRIALNEVFHLPLPGPKMIWEFGERGYDISINTCGDGSLSDDCRTSPKPPHWEYLENTDRTDLFQVLAQLNYLKQTYDEFTPDNFNYDLTGTVKWYRLSKGANHVFTVGNFGTQTIETSVTFPVTGKWYRFFAHDSTVINSQTQNITLAPGEYRLYSTRKMDETHVITENTSVKLSNNDFAVYPNPAGDVINVSSKEAFTGINISSINGKLIRQMKFSADNNKTVNIESFPPGIYLIQLIQKGKRVTKKIVVK